MSLEDKFKNSVNDIKNITKKPPNDELLELYSLYKQSTCGDVTSSQPWSFQVTRRAKYDAWNGKKGLSQDDAKIKYIELVETLINKYK